MMAPALAQGVRAVTGLSPILSCDETTSRVVAIMAVQTGYSLA